MELKDAMASARELRGLYAALEAKHETMLDLKQHVGSRLAV